MQTSILEFQNFVYHDPNQTLREKELQRARALSHAARVGHNRRCRRRANQDIPRHQHRDQVSACRNSKGQIVQTVLDKETIRMPKPLRGNSDPFSSLAIDVTPEINHIIRFVREVAIPSTYFNSIFQRMSSSMAQSAACISSLEQSKFISSPGALRDWNQLRSSLSDECAALARLAGYASVMAQVMPDGKWAAVASLKMQVRAIRLLHDFIAQEQPSLEQAKTMVLPSLYGLFRTECINGNVNGVACHAGVLKSIFEQGYFTPQLLIQTLCHDVDLALKKTHKTFLDVDDWCPRALEQTLKYLREALPMFKETRQTFHPTISHPRLLQLWRRRHLFAVIIYEAPFPEQKWQQQSTGDMAFMYMTLVTFIEHGQMINMYIDLMEGAILKEVDPTERYVQAALIIGVLYLARRNAHESLVAGVDVRDASNELMTQLEISTRTAWICCSSEERPRYNEAFLWLLYVGTLYEIHKQKRAQPVLIWFAPRLRWQANAMNVTKWPEMLEIAKMFLHSEIVQPDGSFWFEDLVRGSTYSDLEAQPVEDI